MLLVEQLGAQARRQPNNDGRDPCQDNRCNPACQCRPGNDMHRDLPSPVVGASQLEHDRALTRDDMRRADAVGRS